MNPVLNHIVFPYSISVILLSYKEAENLQMLLPRIKHELDTLGVDYEILIVDTAEPLDNTKEICEKFGVSYHPQEWRFYGGAFRTGIKYATKDCVLVLDADGSHNPVAIPAMCQKYASGYDIVIGSRYTHGGISRDSKASWLMSKILNIVMRLALGLHANDISTSFRIYDAKQLKGVQLTRNNYDILQEVLLRMRMSSPALKIGEIPIVFEKRMFGKSKRKLMQFILSYMKTLMVLSLVRLKGLGAQPQNSQKFA